MYCINCGVKLADTENLCPLCGTEVFHPDYSRPDVSPLYPRRAEPSPHVSSRASQIIVTTMFVMAIMIILLCDLQISGGITWSGFAAGGILLVYELFILPYWFRDPNPVIFVPCGFAAVGVYLLYINHTLSGNWFLSFAFPVTGYTGLVVTAMVVLVKYLRKGYLYIFGGVLIALGGFMPLMELLLCVTFEPIRFFGWSWYPLIALGLLGVMLIFLAVHRPSREMMERKFFL